jgi:hypothetical protein
MQPDSVFRFVSVRPPTIKLPNLDPQPATDPSADKIVEQAMSDARAGARDESAAHKKVAGAIRDTESLAATPLGQQLLARRARADSALAKLPEKYSGAQFVDAMKDIFASALAEGGVKRGEEKEALAALKTSAWLTYYAGLLDPDREPYYEEAMFWIRILHQFELAERDDGIRPLPALNEIRLAAPLRLLLTQSAPAPRDDDGGSARGFDIPAGRTVIHSPAGRATIARADAEAERTAALADGAAIEQLITKLHDVQARRRDALRRLPARQDPFDAERERRAREAAAHEGEEEAPAELRIVGPVLYVPNVNIALPGDVAGNELSNDDRNLLLALALNAETTPVPRLIDELQLALARAAARLATSQRQLERHGRTFVEVSGRGSEGPH